MNQAFADGFNGGKQGGNRLPRARGRLGKEPFAGEDGLVDGDGQFTLARSVVIEGKGELLDGGIATVAQIGAKFQPSNVFGNDLIEKGFRSLTTDDLFGLRRGFRIGLKVG